MTDHSAPFSRTARLAAIIAAAGLLFALPAAAQTRLPPPAVSSTADARQDRIEELETQLREAEARNEQLQRQLNEANRNVNRLQGLVDEAVGVNRSLQEGLTAPAPADGATPAPTQRSGGSAEAAPSELTGAQRAATGTLGSMSASTTDTATPVMDPADAYSRARELLVDGNYAEAEVAFEDFLQRYPQAPTAADARFWFAFTQLARNNYQDAAANFVQYLRDTPQGPRAPEAQVRLGMALAGMEQRAQACQAFSSLVRRYPNAARNIRDLAAREARAAQCAA
ncbi:tol-pal system protein YbgF [Terricaulis silvestris]|uniref:Cell division coordinator CpoB n=1 Tax=Terricaulis silvestris TaxID=2686094 RepID=A0A6I6MXM0_9CAUL|nr:tol-pal system protein YbgF [Terricaulis silvestris]QGZ96382.1 tol-pal system protein YbgF [Terricaulis silvestris]